MKIYAQNISKISSIVEELLLRLRPALHEIEDKGRRPVDLGTEQVGKILLVQIFGNHPQPEQVDGKKDRNGQKVKLEIKPGGHGALHFMTLDLNYT